MLIFGVEYWKKNLIILWLSLFLAFMGLSSVVPFLPLFIRELGVTGLAETARWSGYVFAAPFLVSFFVTPLWGTLGDKYGRKLMTLRAVFGLAVSMLLMGFTSSVEMLLFFRVLQGLLSGFYSASIALVAANTPKDKTAYALGIIQSAGTTGNILGPLIGGVISDLLGFRAVFIVVGVLCFAIGIAISLWLREDEQGSGAGQAPAMLDNWKYVLTTPQLLAGSVLFIISAFGVAFIRPVFVLYVESFHIQRQFLPTVTGALESTLGIFSAFASFSFGRQAGKRGMVSTLVAGGLLVAAMYALHSVISGVWYLIPVRVLLGLGYGMITPALYTHFTAYASEERKGGVIGIASSWQTLGNLLGPLASGFVAGTMGLRFPFLVTGLLFVLFAAIALTTLRSTTAKNAVENAFRRN